MRGMVPASNAVNGSAPNSDRNRSALEQDPQRSKLKMPALMVSPVSEGSAITARGNRLALGPARRAITDLDALPFVDRSLIDLGKYVHSIGETMAHGVITLLATRGCPYSCTYCHRIMSKKLHFRSPQNIFDEVRQYYDLGFRRFSFVDD